MHDRVPIPTAPSRPPDGRALVEAAFEHAVIGMALLDADGGFVRANDAMYRLLVLPRHEPVGIGQLFANLRERA